ncbi:hypothetical protein FRC0474_02401 [Corynebacterium diphtheriae]|nr:hypothetical protein FRC0474_02401 [Corynebacterium diphtheriae]
MKRLPQTLTAAVLTGALAFGGAAVAQAQIPAPVVDNPITDRTFNGEAQVAEGIPDPETITVDGVEYFEDGRRLQVPPQVRRGSNGANQGTGSGGSRQAG